jgi:hypothetical protein
MSKGRFAYGGYTWVYPEDVDVVLGQHHPRKGSIRVAQFGLDGNLVKVWNSAKEAAKRLGCGRGQISNVCTGRWYTAHGYQWRYYDPSISHIAPTVVDAVHKRAVIQLADNGEMIRKWESASAAARDMNVDTASIYHCLIGQTKHSAGYRWKYDEVA